MSRVVSPEGLDTMVRALRAEGRTVIGPVVRDGVIAPGEISGIDDLPRGWTEHQEPGSYRLEPTGTGELFAFSSPATSWKSYLYPERTLLVRARRDADGTTIETGDDAAADDMTDGPGPFAFVGIRSCDLAGLQVLDRVLLDPAATDPTYARRRADLFVVAVACSSPGRTCFCASMDTGPSPTSGFDLAVVERHDNGRHDFIVTVGTEAGRRLLETVESSPGGENEDRDRDAIHHRAVAAMGRRLDPADPPAAANVLDDPRWDDIAERCLSCGNCTMVCPTCFCSTTEDTTNLLGTSAERWRVWDSCFTLDFTHMHGGPARPTTASRYRQWLLHKLVTWHDQFGTSGCVGCGRCITSCPVGIDLTFEVAELARSARATSVHERREAET